MTKAIAMAFWLHLMFACRRSLLARTFLYLCLCSSALSPEIAKGQDELLGLMRAAAESPNDLLRYEIIADWHEEHGKPQRGELIRTSLALEQIRTLHFNSEDAIESSSDAVRYQSLEAREQELRELLKHELLKELQGIQRAMGRQPSSSLDHASGSFEIRRGFIELTGPVRPKEIAAAGKSENDPDAVLMTRAFGVVIVHNPADIKIIATANLSKLNKLSLNVRPAVGAGSRPEFIDEEAWLELFNSPKLAHVTELQIEHYSGHDLPSSNEPDELKALQRALKKSSLGRSLQKLTIIAALEDCSELLASEFPALSDLELDSTEQSAEWSASGLQRIAESKVLRTVTKLSLDGAVSTLSIDSVHAFFTALQQHRQLRFLALPHALPRLDMRTEREAAIRGEILANPNADAITREVLLWAMQLNHLQWIQLKKPYYDSDKKGWPYKSAFTRALLAEAHKISPCGGLFLEGKLKVL